MNGLIRYFFFGLAVSYMTGGKKAAEDWTSWYVRNLIAALICVACSFVIIGLANVFGADTAGAYGLFPMFAVLYVGWLVYDWDQRAEARRAAQKKVSKVGISEFLKRVNAAARRNSQSHR